MIDRYEGHFLGYGEADLFYQSWIPKDQPRATLIITHGQGEHSDSYHKTAMDFSSAGYSVFAWDLRGHGRSEGKRGYIEDFQFYVRDLDFFFDFLLKNNKISGPAVLFGHSMGGLVLLKYLLDEGIGRNANLPVLAHVLSSPALGLSVPVPKVKDIAARVLLDVWPTLTLYNEIRDNNLTSLPDYLRDYERDSLRHHKISSAVYFGMVEGFKFVLERASSLKGPTLIQAAGKEKIVSLNAIKSFYEVCGSEPKKLIVYDQSLHEIYNDQQRERVIADADQFIRALL